MLWPTITASPMNSSSAGITSAMRGAGSTIDSVMPVSTVMNGGIATPGFTSVSKRPRHSPPRSLTAPTSVISQSFADAPVVSRSRTTNVTSDSGCPSSSSDACRWAADERRATARSPAGVPVRP